MRRQSTALVTVLRVAAFACCLQLAIAYPFIVDAQQPPGAPAATQQPAAPPAPDINAQTPGRGPQRSRR